MPSALRNLAGHGEAGALKGVHSDDGGQQAGPHDAAPPGALPLVQRGDHAVGAVHPGEQIGDRRANAGGLVGICPGQAHQSGLTLGDLVVSGATALRPVVPKPSDGQHHQPGVELVQPVGGKAQPVKDPGAEVLHQHIGGPDQPRQRLPAIVALQIQREGFLVAVAGQKVGRLPIVGRSHERRAPAACVITGAGHLDFDDSGTEVAEHHGGVGAGQPAGEIDDDNAVQ